MSKARSTSNKVRISYDSTEGLPREGKATVSGKSMGSVEWILLLVLSILWGGSFFFNKVAVRELPPLTIVLARVCLGAIVLNLIVFACGLRMPKSIKQWGAFLVMGLINNLIPISLIVWGQTQIASSLASILNATTPIFTVILAHLMTKDERLNGVKLAGFCLGFVGVIVLIGFDALKGFNYYILAELACILAAVAYATAGIYGRRFKGVPPLITATGQVTMTTVMMLPLVILIDKPWALTAPSLPVWGALLGLGLLSTALGYLIYFRILQTSGATNVLLVTFLIPISALFLGIMILKERLELQHVLGMALVLISLIVIDGRLIGVVRRFFGSQRSSEVEW